MTIVTLASLDVDMSRYSLCEYAQWMRSWGAASSTITRRMTIARVIATRNPNPDNVTPETLTTYLATPGFSPWTRATYYGHLRSLFGWLADTERIESDPTTKVRRPRSPAAKPRPLTPPEVADALAAADKDDLRTWLLLGMFAGLRAHETAKLHGRDITEHSLYVRGKGGKDSVLPTHPLLWRVAEHYPRDGFWFPSRYADREHVASVTISGRITRLFEQVGVTGSYHRCRHTYGTNLLRSGANLRVVQDLMRHSSLATTAAYLGVDEDERQAAIRGLAA